MKNHILGVFLFGLATVLSLTLLYGVDLGKNWLEVSGSTAKEYEVPIRRVQTEDLQAALTFNVSCPEDRCREILEDLEEGAVKASFFVTKEWAESHGRELEQIREKGHELGLLEKDEKTEEEIRAASEQLEQLAGQEVRYFRPQGKDCGTRVFRNAKAAGLQILGWSLDSLDWKEYGKEALIRRIRENLKSGDLILFRADAGNTPEALGELLEGLREEGWMLTGIAELLEGRQGYTDRQGTWHPEEPHT